MKRKKYFTGIDLFAGAGGLSLGAQMAGIDVDLAIEQDPHAAATYALNHPGAKLIIDYIANINDFPVSNKNRISFLFGGPPCQGFSTSNQRTRNKANVDNWLFREFIRIAKIYSPDWIVFENVKGLIETEGGLFKDIIINHLKKIGYTCTSGALCAADFGVPQIRSRFFIIGSKNKIKITLPVPTTHHRITVKEAISDLPKVDNGANIDYLTYSNEPEMSRF